VHLRILIGAGAWLLGAAAATGGSLLAVSLLGQGMDGASGSELTSAAVHRALASESQEARASAPVPLASGTAKAPGPASARPSPHSAPGQSTTPAASSSSAAPTAAATTATPAQSPPTSMDGTVLTSQGGEVVAACEQGGAYLISWSPQQAYEVDTVSRGPATQALASFESDTNKVTMTITCANGVPSATSAASTTAVDR
jgi:serine/threonine-protein kinase